MRKMKARFVHGLIFIPSFSVTSSLSHSSKGPFLLPSGLGTGFPVSMHREQGLTY